MTNKILSHNEISENPPVLIDIGASAHLPEDWRVIAPYSICIAFDADNRDIDYIVNEEKKYKKLYTFNSIVVDSNEELTDFFLTKSPYCSSTLKPLNKQLEEWSFYKFFEIEKSVKIKSTNLQTVLNKLNVKQIDWFKTDSQGTDLMIFKSLGQDIYSNILVADFEPGIIDAYQNEDKLYHLLEFMDKSNFWISDINIGGNQKINKTIKELFFNDMNEFQLQSILKYSPTCAEITYINNFKKNNLTKRDFLLGIVFSIIKNQLPFALELAYLGKQRFNESFFDEIKDYLLQLIKNKLCTLNNSSQKSSINNKKDFIKDFIPPILLKFYRKTL
ncbi:MAG: FkbM family methyltransferase [Bacteroidales bacterium]|jgi:hypothetical protein